MLSKHDGDTRAQTPAAAGHTKPKATEPFSFMLDWNDPSGPQTEEDAKAMRHTYTSSDPHCVHGETRRSTILTDTIFTDNEQKESYRFYRS